MKMKNMLASGPLLHHSYLENGKKHNKSVMICQTGIIVWNLMGKKTQKSDLKKQSYHFGLSFIVC
jgi:hypothetical protein